MSLGVGRTAPTCKEVCCKPAGFHSVRGVSSLLPAVLGAKYTYFLKTQQFLWYLCRKVYMMPDNSTPRKTLHPRNIHLAGYDFKKLTKVNPALRDYMITTPDGRESVDFSHPSAVLQLNKSLLSAYYNVANWSVMKNGLCPPIPGRADYIHYLSDLLTTAPTANRREADGTRVLDIGTGSSCIYPILGQRIYQWKFVGTDIDQAALNHAQATLKANSGLKRDIELRLQPHPSHIFDGVIQPEEYFDAVMCNPPFFRSREHNWQKTTKKFNNLNRDQDKLPVQNFGGHPNELWCEGGERQFVRTMIYESMDYSEQLGWITSLIADKDNVKPLVAILEYHQAPDIKVIPMAHGNKAIRILAWRWHR
ncbi:MAG TPA: 23S rRNA (adenine(1618)-N(6))-methyltransferase RlmF [Sphingobacterium sp.]|nr:23S rRNA (adenine(1618)-N(6))-methyltransferase RlmF [Sphingobacterium sp.]